MAADNATTYTRRWCGTGEIAFLTLSNGTRLRYLKVGPAWRAERKSRSRRCGRLLARRGPLALVVSRISRKPSELTALATRSETVRDRERGHHSLLLTTTHVDVPCAWSLPSASSILPSSVMMVRPRETTWPITCIAPESTDIGRTNLAVVSCDGQASPGESVVWAASAMTVSSIVMIQPP